MDSKPTSERGEEHAQRELHGCREGSWIVESRPRSLSLYRYYVTRRRRGEHRSTSTTSFTTLRRRYARTGTYFISSTHFFILHHLARSCVPVDLARSTNSRLPVGLPGGRLDLLVGRSTLPVSIRLYNATGRYRGNLHNLIFRQDATSNV